LSTEQRENPEAALRRSPIQAGTHEVLLDDAVRLAQKAAAADVAVTLDLTPKVPHVFQNFYPILDEAADALDRARKLLTAHLERRNTCEQQ
jgi:acetyl esterase/lipase